MPVPTPRRDTEQQFNYVHFQESHRRHHQSTLHPPDDLEVTLPITWKLKPLVLSLVFDPRGLYWLPIGWVNAVRGKLEGEWNNRILPVDGPSRRQEYVRMGAFRGGGPSGADRRLSVSRTLDDTGADNPRASVRHLAAVSLQRHAACGPAGQRAGLPALLPHDLPESVSTVPVLAQTWKQIIGILKRQRQEPGYQYVAPLPEAS